MVNLVVKNVRKSVMSTTLASCIIAKTGNSAILTIHAVSNKERRGVEISFNTRVDTRLCVAREKKAEKERLAQEKAEKGGSHRKRQKKRAAHTGKGEKERLARKRQKSGSHRKNIQTMRIYRIYTQIVDQYCDNLRSTNRTVRLVARIVNPNVTMTQLRLQ